MYVYYSTQIDPLIARDCGERNIFVCCCNKCSFTFHSDNKSIFIAIVVAVISTIIFVWWLKCRSLLDLIFNSTKRFYSFTAFNMSFQQKNHNEHYQIETIQNELNLYYTPKDIGRFKEKWNKYTEHQTLHKLICDIPLIDLRNTALSVINPHQSTRTPPSTRNPQTTDEEKSFIDYLKHTSLLNRENDGKLSSEQRLSCPPPRPFGICKAIIDVDESYGDPVCVPVSAVMLSARKLDIDVSKYDFVSLRRSIKRVLSFSEALNTNFQCINGTIFAEDVAIGNTYYPYNYGYQFEMHCVDASAGLRRAEAPRDDRSKSDDSDVIGSHLLRGMKEECADKCVAFRKESDYYHLIEVEICDLKLLLCAEIDCVDGDLNLSPIELKFGTNDKLISIWSQCLLSGIRNVVQAQKTYQRLCVMVTDVVSTDMSCYYSSKPHQNAQLLVFYNILKDVQSKVMASYESKKGKQDDGYCASNIYRLTRLRSHTEATMFEVDDAEDLISKQQWQCLMQKEL
eukprot:949046_1